MCATRDMAAVPAMVLQQDKASEYVLLQFAARELFDAQVGTGDGASVVSAPDHRHDQEQC